MKAPHEEVPTPAELWERDRKMLRAMVPVLKAAVELVCAAGGRDVSASELVALTDALTSNGWITECTHETPGVAQ